MESVPFRQSRFLFFLSIDYNGQINVPIGYEPMYQDSHPTVGHNPSCFVLKMALRPAFSPPPSATRDSQKLIRKISIHDRMGNLVHSGASAQS